MSAADFAKATVTQVPPGPEETALLASLRTIVSSDGDLDSKLDFVANAARRFTHASASALAMWKDGVMVCRARGGDLAPPLGARLSADKGISGECLRTGMVQYCADTENNPLVDLEVCRSLGLRSIAVLPIHGASGVNGILEVFSAHPSTFTEHHLALLSELAVLAEIARATAPKASPVVVPIEMPSQHGAQSVSELSTESPTQLADESHESHPSGILPASDSLGDVTLATVAPRSRRLVVGAIVGVFLLLLGLAIWLGVRGADRDAGYARAASPPRLVAANASANSSPNAPANALANVAASQSRVPDNDPVWKPNPGGEPISIAVGKPAAGSPVRLASKADVIVRKFAPPSTSGNSAQPAMNAATAQQANAPSQQPAGAETFAVVGEAGNSSTLTNVLTAKASLPTLGAPVSQGISGGKLLLQVPPVYPQRERTKRIEGKVVLDALVNEDGSVASVKVVEGPQALAQSAIAAVKQWRYQPFLLDGAPVKKEMTITINFKLP